MRTDCHSPKNIKPEDYDFVTMYFHDDWYANTNYTREFTNHMKMTGGKFSQHKHGGDCMVCGAFALTYAIFYHEPSNSYIKTGKDCSAKLESGLDGVFKKAQAEYRDGVKINKGIKKAYETLDELGLTDQIDGYFGDRLGGVYVGWNIPNPYASLLYTPETDDWDTENPDYDPLKEVQFRASHFLGDIAYDLPEFLIRSYLEKYRIVVDMVRNLVRYGSWSEKQEEYVVNLCKDLEPLAIIERNEKIIEEKKTEVPAPEGRVTITGEVVAKKVQEGYYQDTLKMLVKCDGFKVWSTVPDAIWDVNVGDTITMAITLTRSENDESFAIGKRPAKAEVIEEVKEVA